MNELEQSGETWHRQRKQQNREELIAAGRTLFLRHAFPGVSIKDVCELAGVSRVTYYKHFASIDELAFEVQMRALEHMASAIRAADPAEAGDEPGDPASGSRAEPSGAARLRRMLEAWSAYAAADRDYMKFILLFDLHYDAYPPEPSLLARYDAFVRENKDRHFLNGALAAGIRDGSLRADLDLRETGEFVFTAMMGLLQKRSLSEGRHEEGDDTLGRISRRFIEMILHSLQP